MSKAPPRPASSFNKAPSPETITLVVQYVGRVGRYPREDEREIIGPLQPVQFVHELIRRQYWNLLFYTPAADVTFRLTGWRVFYKGRGEVFEVHPSEVTRGATVQMEHQQIIITEGYLDIITNGPLVQPG